MERRASSWSSSQATRSYREGSLPRGDENLDRRRYMEDTGPYSSGVVGRWEGIGQCYREAPLLLWSYEVDDGLDPAGHHGDEDQGPSHRLVAGVQVAADGE